MNHIPYTELGYNKLEDPKELKKGLFTPDNDINITNENDISIEIPKQIITGNICPINSEGKGDYFIPQSKIWDTAKHLKIDPETISPDAWSEKNGAVYVSWKGFYHLPERIQAHWKDLAVKKGLDFGIKSGKQQDGRFIIVFDCDNEKASEYRDFIINLYGETFVRSTPSGGYHVYYESLNGGILKNNMHIDLRSYLTIDDNPMDMEIKQGSFVKEIGNKRSTDSDLPIKKVDFENIDLIQNIQWTYPGWKLIKKFTENGNGTAHINNESLEVLKDELLFILNETYLPRYIEDDLHGLRDNTIIPATFGFLIKRNMPEIQMKAVLEWINSIAENSKPGSMDERHYDFNNIPDVLAGSGVLIKNGFDDFVTAINNLDPEYISKRQTQKVLGEHTINTVSLEYPTNHLPMFETLQDIVGIRSQSHTHILKMVYYSLVSAMNPKTTIHIHGAKHDPRISIIFVGKQGQGKTEIQKTVRLILNGRDKIIHSPTTFHADQFVGKTKVNKKKGEDGVTQIMGYLYDDVIIIDEAKRLISDPDFAEIRRTARISQNRYGTSPVEKKNVDTHNNDKISYDSHAILFLGVQDMQLDAEDFIIEGDLRRYAVSVLDNETMDSQEDIIRDVMDPTHNNNVHPQVFADYLEKIPELGEHLGIELGIKERVIYERAAINLNARANSYSKKTNEYYGTLGAEYLTVLLKFVVNYALIRMVKNGINSENIKITEDDILFGYVDCFEMLEHRYEWTHFYLVSESALVHKGAKYTKEIDVLSGYDIGQPIQKGHLRDKIQQVYGVKKERSRQIYKNYIKNGFITEINTKTATVKKLPGKRVQRKDDLSIEMYNHALEKINNIKTPSIKKQTITEPSDWDQDETVEPQSELNK